MSRIFLFDVDGTLTPPRQAMSSGFADYFSEFVRREIVFLVSGSDYSKIKEQVPVNILMNCKGVFGCSGAEYFENCNLMYRKEHTFPDELLTLVENFIDSSPYRDRYGTHVEHRPGMLNISVIGRDATLLQRNHYHEWDRVRNERSTFAKHLMEAFPNYEASCGGEISIDIVPAGWNKSVIKQAVLADFPSHQLIFFGDKMGRQGNDKPLADVLNTPSGKHRAIEVEDFKDTWIQLRHFSQSEKKIDSTAVYHTDYEPKFATVH